MASLTNSNTPGATPEASADGEMQVTPATISEAEKVIKRFGGIRPMAGKLGVPVTTVQGWKKRGAIPANRVAELQEGAARLGISLDDLDLIAATSPMKMESDSGAGEPPESGASDGRPTPVEAGGGDIPTGSPVTAIDPEASAVAAPAVETPLPETAALTETAALAGATPGPAIGPGPEPVEGPAADSPPAQSTPAPEAPDTTTPVAPSAEATPPAEPPTAAAPPAGDAAPAAQSETGSADGPVETPLETVTALPPAPPAIAAPAPEAPTIPAVTVPDPSIPEAPAALSDTGTDRKTTDSGIPSPAPAPVSGQTAEPPPTTPPLPRIDTAAEIPAVSIPTFQVPPASIALREAPEAARARPGEPARRPVVAGRGAAAYRNGNATHASPIAPSSDETSGTGSGAWAALAAAAAIVALIAAGVSVVVPMFNLGSATSASSVLDLEQRIGKLESQFSRSSIQQLQAANTLEKRIDTVDRRVTQATRESGESAAALAERIAAVERALPQLEQKIRTMPAGSPTLGTLLAASELRQALAGYEPFQTALGAVRYAGVNAPEVNEVLAALSGRAPTGILTEGRLARWFDDFGPTIVAAGSSGIIARVGDGMIGLLAAMAPPVYYGIGFGDSNIPRAIVARAKAALRNGNLALAVRELEQLQDEASRHAEPWLTEARARLIANHARHLLSNYMMAIVSTHRTEP